MNKIKQLVKVVLKYFHLDLTRNMKYDRETEKVIKKVLKNNSCTIDIGCHKGEMLEQFIAASPQGKHFAFEPIPEMYNELLKKFSGPFCAIYPYALADKAGTAEFNYVKNAPAYSGLKQREYAVEKPEIEKLKVEVKRLDEVISPDQCIDLIKIDVEGAELGVLKGSENIIRKHKPVIIFECGLGASEFYGTKPEEVYHLLVKDYGLQLSTMNNWLGNRAGLSEKEFCDRFYNRKDYYFIAYLAISD